MDDPGANAAAQAQRRRILAAKGRRSTILTGALGDETEANIGLTTILGA
jgi:hypothetical protein